MGEGHVAEDLLDRFLRADVSREEAREIVRHLLTGCPRCSETAHRTAQETGLFVPSGAGGAAGWEQAYEKVFARALAFASEEERRGADERLRGWAQWAMLEPLAPPARLAIVESESAFHTFGLYDRLLEASRWAQRSEPAEAVDIVHLAITVARRLDPARIGKRRVADLQVAAWAALGNAQRIAEDFERAAHSFNEAWRLLEEEGTNDPLDRASLISLEASYIQDIGEFETAESALEEALEIYREAGDVHLQGRALFQMGHAIGYIKPKRGISHIQKALALIDTTREPRLELSAQHSLAQYFAESGQPEEALAVLERARPLYEQLGDELTQLRLHWVEGKIAHRLGKYVEAEHIFSQLWEELHARNLNQEVVLVSIEMAQVLTRKGEPVRAAELAAQCFSVMKSWRLHNDAVAAWIVFQEALAEGAAQGDLFAKIEAYYRRHWVRPARFSA